MTASGSLLLALFFAVVAGLAYQQHRVAVRNRDDLLAQGVPESTRLNAEAAPRDLLRASIIVAVAAVVTAVVGLAKALF